MTSSTSLVNVLQTRAVTYLSMYLHRGYVGKGGVGVGGVEAEAEVERSLIFSQAQQTLDIIYVYLSKYLSSERTG